MATRQACDICLDHYQEALFKNDNLAFLSVVAKTDDLGSPTAVYVLRAGVYDLERQVRNAAAAKLAADLSQTVPAQLRVPGTKGKHKGRDAVEVEIVQTDPIVALSFINRVRPVGGGSSIGPSHQASAGTFGARITVNGQEGYFLTNWHVLHDGSGSPAPGVLQQGRLDGGVDPRDRIGVVYWSVLNAYADAAIGRASSIGDLSYSMRCWGPITGVANPTLGMAVKKCGRTSEATIGRIQSINASVRVNGYPGGARLFQDQIQMTPMLAAGDSGSILLTQANKVVGLCFAGSSSNSFANKFQRVQSLALDGTSIGSDGGATAGSPITIAFDRRRAIKVKKAAEPRRKPK